MHLSPGGLELVVLGVLRAAACRQLALVRLATGVLDLGEVNVPELLQLNVLVELVHCREGAEVDVIMMSGGRRT